MLVQKIQFAGWRRMIFQDSAGSRSTVPCRTSWPVGGDLNCQMELPAVAAMAQGIAWSDPGLGGVAILGWRTGFGGACWEASRSAPQLGSACCPRWTHQQVWEPVGMRSSHVPYGVGVRFGGKQGGINC